MTVLTEEIIIYLIVGLFSVIVFYYYLFIKRKQSVITEEKIEKAKKFGLYEPISLHPVVDQNSCIGSGACIKACPEKDILGIVNGKAQTINASQCVGHGACFHACPVEAISLVMGTEKRGVDLPHVSPKFETNIKGIYIAGELGGMGLIKNAVEQGKQAVENITKKLQTLEKKSDLDLLIIGAGPAGIGASLQAKKNNLKFKTLDQESLGGTVFSFPRSKIIMTSPMDIPLHGKVKLVETSKSALLSLWNEILSKNKISIHEFEKVENIICYDNYFEIESVKGKYSASSILLAIGRRGSPKKLGVPGEEKEKVYYKLLEPELIENKKVLVVGGGDSAIESALLIAEGNNEVTLSYRNSSFNRLKPKNLENILEAEKNGKINVLYNSNVLKINDNNVEIKKDSELLIIKNDLVYIFAGGELPNKFLEKIGIRITKKYGEVILKH